MPRIALARYDSAHTVWFSNYNDYQQTQYYQVMYDYAFVNLSGNLVWLNQGQWAVSENQPPPLSWDAREPDVATNFLDFQMQTTDFAHIVWSSPGSQTGTPQIWYRKKADDFEAPCVTTLSGTCFPIGDPYLWWGHTNCLMPEDSFAAYIVYRYDFPDWHPIDTVPYNPSRYMEFTDNGRGCGTSSSYYVVSLDLAENESQPSNIVTVGGPPPPIGDQVVGLDPGTQDPTPNTIRRAGYYTWGSHPSLTVDYDPLKLVYRISGLNKELAYGLAVGYYQPDRRSGRRQSLLVDGVELQHAIPVPDRPVTCFLRVPPATYQDGEIEVSVRREQGSNAVLALLDLYRVKKGGPQSDIEVSNPNLTFALHQNAPNPMTDKTGITFVLPRRSEVNLKIYNAMGQLIKTLVSEDMASGYHSATWDGKKASGQNVPNGVYFYRLQAGGKAQTRTLTLMR